MSASPSTKLRLAFRSGGRCARPGCDRELVVESETGDDNTSIGQAAHIAGEKPIAKRYDPCMTDEERDHYNNLI